MWSKKDDFFSGHILHSLTSFRKLVEDNIKLYLQGSKHGDMSPFGYPLTGINHINAMQVTFAKKVSTSLPLQLTLQKHVTLSIGPRSTYGDRAKFKQACKYE